MAMMSIFHLETNTNYIIATIVCLYSRLGKIPRKQYYLSDRVSFVLELVKLIN
jgi:hypothetical protein